MRKRGVVVVRHDPCPWLLVTSGEDVWVVPRADGERHWWPLDRRAAPRSVISGA
ncbi:hypothetical protein [Nocardioides terrigena]|uniref:hypothetical protein n=1 Tax=Nocardioides terrigena TaxID=424797 RepID=UPI00131F43FC|nr:hypothetical protein [Nocardioides terrigena]